MQDYKIDMKMSSGPNMTITMQAISKDDALEKMSKVMHNGGIITTSDCVFRASLINSAAISNA